MASAQISISLKGLPAFSNSIRKLQKKNNDLMWSLYKEWCNRHNIKPQYASSLFRYMKKIK